MLLINWLKKPYFFISSPKFNFALCLGVGLFIFLFLYIFQPFGITSILNNKLIYTAGFGLITFFCSLFFFMVLPYLFRKFFNDESWTVGKNILFLFLLVFTITFGNYFYNSIVQNTENMSLLSLTDFFAYTFSLAIFPVVIFTFVSEKLYRMHRENIAKEIKPLNTSVIKEKKYTAIKLYGDNNKENISFDIEDLIYVTSQGNYASIYLKSEKGVEENILRNTLSNIVSKLENHSTIKRCHKSYIVNSKYMNTISGNARGYYLESSLLNKPIPVSRSFKKEDLQNLIS